MSPVHCENSTYPAMRGVNVIVLLSTLSTSILATEPTRPRGVAPKFAKFYQSVDSFSCVLNPEIKLSLSQVNDDYCDCPDGTDEPGTAACSYISPLSPSQPAPANAHVFFALAGFYCYNKGHIASYIPHIHVNDGVCDYELCCDGTDENAGVGGVKCEDKCKEIGEEWRKADEIRSKSAKAAAKERINLVNEAQALRAGVEISIRNLEAEVTVLEQKAEELKKKYEEVERKERGRMVTSTGKGSKVTVLAGLAKARVNELREALINVVDKRDKMKERLEELEKIMATFKEEYNPNFNDEGVKRAVHAWEDYAAQKLISREEAESAEDRDFAEIMKEDSESEGINWAEWETEEESDVEALYKFEEYLPEPIREWVHQRIIDVRIMLIENGILADHANSGSESKTVSDARSALQAVSDEVSTKSSKVGELRRDLEKDYGADDIFRALKDKCISKDSGEYEYELCWMGNTKQKSKKGGSHTGMGNFVKFDKMVVNEEISADGKGLGRGERIVLSYENGQNCWNGPNRQTTVVLACAEKDEIWKVVEEEKCMYKMEVGTPAACEATEEKKPEGKKDEL
ncbi:glucosidase 2 subunit beta precursor [Drepanopeziza brunnea f. sp. 'multigermtubi' MB_m1]|uniref:Glucosidase 2 subunit beta n=2 Tax=Drepanopeziza brunnea f. sp. 'multigermtubi' TaxID=698441 RepID=K1X5K7_MARBU|nr:glucosidase 2 subunit beta precursor [Drepanopeziza brunnea f. sp. 'multigermtubi' MB_m1]EKD15933.1 glucosidase 2 subunit beta precursor [Drepanopeziza brunnea f. sp. 'multigermtubi' MB_m1]